LKELQSLACLKAGNEQVLDSAEELAGVIKVRQLLYSLRDFLQARSEVFAEALPSRPRLVAKLSAPIDEGVAAVSLLRVFVAVGAASIFWFATAWPAGDTFLIWVAIGTCRFVIAPDPSKAVGNKSAKQYEEGKRIGETFVKKLFWRMIFYICDRRDRRHWYS
jgi:uncharacterized membrane protein YccC